MELALIREPSGARSTLGKLWCGDEWLCDTLEDRVRQPKGWGPLDPVAPWKVPGETAIPTGRYRITVTWSERFKRNLPLLNAVPGFAGIRIHSGNTHEDTEGCILVGHRMGPGTVVESRASFALVRDLIQGALGRGEQVWMTVRSAINGDEAAR